MGSVALAAEEAQRPRRARPPEWPQAVLDAFFEDARTALEGPRPDVEAVAEPAARRSPATGTSGSTVGPETEQRPPRGTPPPWSTLVDSTTLETEVKRIAASLGDAVATPTGFKGGGYRVARRDLSVLAVLMAVIGEHDGQPRWQDSAAGFRDLFARAGDHLRQGNGSTHREAQLRQQDLAALIRGSRPRVPKAEAGADWRHVADLAPLMQRMEMAQRERLVPWLADGPRFERHRDEIHHEAQIVAMLAAAIGREGFDYTAEEEYAGPAGELQAAAVALATAADQDDFDAASAALSRASNACADCHASYR